MPVRPGDPGREIHVILDNFATHKTELVKQSPAEHPHVSLHCTPTYSSWLNQVETWFSKLRRDVIGRGDVTLSRGASRGVYILYVFKSGYNTYVTTKLTLSLDPAVITRAKRYAKQRGVSVSAMVETYLAAVSRPLEAAETPQVRKRLQGILKGADPADYRRHLERKYK